MHQKQEIIKRLLQNTAEIITEEEFTQALDSGKQLTHYIGFEISGYVHIGQGIMSALVIRDLQELGVKCTVWLADWHTAINKKLDGSKETAASIGKGYFTEAMKASLLAVGADPEKVEFRLASEWYAKDPMKYWEFVVSVMQNTTLSRMQRSISIMGKKEGESVDTATLMYPAMQVADIFYQDLDIAHAGMDQRKAHVVMRDAAAQVVPNRAKPIALHHGLLPGLQAPNLSAMKKAEDIEVEMKMSKSKPDSAIWIHDSVEEIARKINKAYCPLKPEEENTLGEHWNPVLSWTKHILFWNREVPFVVERKEEHGGNASYDSYEKIEADFLAGSLHPMDLKATVAKEIAELLEPAREHFVKPDIAAKKEELDKLLVNR